ncbi:MAG: hypothetical protein LM600_05065 [Thaumarchaeota archaeon]|jgi:hypothetical protein|nr:hypothetical protein [Nitrososphaerota archaeon]
MSQHSRIREILSTLKDVDAEKILRNIGDRIRVYPTPRYLEVHKEYVSELDQKESLCGAFAAAYILRGMGYRFHRGEVVDQDYVAYIARVNVDPRDLERLRKLKLEVARLPREQAEEIVRRNRDIWYRFDDLPTTLKPHELGASPEGVIHAIHEISMLGLRAIPVKTVSRAGDEFLTEEKMMNLLDIIRRSEEYDAQFILNLNTRHLLDSEKIPRLSEKLLLGEKFQEIFRESVGHYIGCGGLIEVDDKCFLILRETYRKYGVHLQPAEHVRKALLRGDGREGGVIIVVPASLEEKTRGILLDRGFRLEIWDNGSPFIPFTSQRTS